MRSVLSVQDLSCVGRCSLTVALPVLSAMGCRCSVLPTVVLSTHTGFPDPELIPLTAHFSAIDSHWHTTGISFDAVTTGYMADPTQVEAVLPLLRRYKKQGSRVIVDPAMGDHGKLYSRLDQAHVAAMSMLAAEADILLPNLTEAALLADLPYRESPEEPYLQQLLDVLLCRYSADSVVITGVTGRDGTIGFCGKTRDEATFSYGTQVIPRQCHGTGDLFAAVFAGSILRERTVYESAVLAADFVRQCVAATPTATPHGVEFELQLPWLWQHI